MKTAVVILNYNGKHFLEQFLPNVVELSGEAEIVVADNASSDDSVEFIKKSFPGVTLITFDKNHGYAQGYNLALQRLDHEYFVILNSDIKVTPNWLQYLEEYLDRNTDVSALQPKVLSYNKPDTFEYAGACGGFIDYYGYPFCRGRIFDCLEKDEGQYDEPIDVMWASGACLVIRAKDFREVGGFDGRFFAYQEEIDLCWRLHLRGKRIMCLPKSVVYHVGSGVLGNDSPLKTYLNFRNNLTLIYKNMPSNRLKKVLFVRWWLDYLAAIHLLVSGKIKNAASILRARRDFAKIKDSFDADREKNIVGSSALQPNIVSNKSLLWQYYARGKRKFSDIFS
jgi:glycosyltransferase, group 2 family